MAVCKGCGKKIEWALIDGSTVPIDRSAPVYTYSPVPRRWSRVEVGGVNHFITCPNANDFNKRKKPA